MIVASEGLIPRSGPLRALDSVADAGVIFISAPAGFGKSVAARQWADSKGDARAFMALDDYDNQMAGFCQRFCALLHRCQPHNTALGDLLATARGRAPQAMALEAVAALSTRRPSLLVFDDLHHLRDTAVVGLLLTLIICLPQGVGVLLISREALPPGFSALRPGRIGPQQLRFTGEDIARLHQKRGSAITPQAAADMARYTGGWPVGVCALLRLEGEREGNGPASLDDFILHNIWPQWNARTRDFMLSTALAGMLHPQLCHALSGEAACAAILNELADGGAFVVRREEGTYAYSPIFQGFLRRRLTESGPARGLALLEAEGRWHLTMGDFYQAVACFIRCESTEGIARCFDMLERTGRGGFEAERMLPVMKSPQVQAVAAQRPALFYFMAWAAYAEGRDRDMARYLDIYYTRCPQSVTDDWVRRRRDMLLWLLDFRRPLLPARAAASTATPVRGGGQGFIAMDMPLLHRGIRDFSPLAQGDIEQAAAQMTAAMQGQPSGESELITACLAAGLFYEQGRCERALALLNGADGERGASPPVALCAGALRAGVLDALGRRAEGDSALANTRAALLGAGVQEPQINLDALHHRRCIAAGDEAAAKSWLALYRGGACPGTHMYGLYTAFTTGRAYMAVGDWDSAIILLTKLSDLARRFRRPLDSIEAQILLAIACWQKRHGFQADALCYLESAVRTACTYGFTALFQGERAGLAGMLQRLKENAEGDWDTAYRDFVGVLCLKLGHRQEDSPAYGPPGPGISFTHKQRRVMGLLCAGKSYREIAHRLDIKLPTLRSHIALIYKKLDVSNEGDAVRRMKALGLLDDLDTGY